MNFDDHEIWGAPVRAAEATSESAAADIAPPAAAAAAAGRLYRSAGSDPHPEAILALPNHRRHVTSPPLDASQWATPSTPVVSSAPITINSRIPRPTTIEDAALAEIAGSASAPAPVAGFTSWFKSSNPLGAITAMRQTNIGATAPEPAAKRGSLGVLLSMSNSTMTAATYAGFLFVLTTVVGVVNAAVSSSLGLPTGLALVVASAIGAWRIDGSARWAAWVLPSYALIAAMVVAGQFTESAPGASPLGQIMLIATELITLAPWLAAASVLGAVLPAIRGRAN